MTSSSFPYSAAELDQFRQVQRLAYDMAAAVEAQLSEGMTEADVCRLIAEAQAAHQVTQVFHQPYAWFGRRTVLGEGPGPAAVGVLDLASAGVLPPALLLPDRRRPGRRRPADPRPGAGRPRHCADVGYSCVFGHNDTFDELDRGLARIRTFLTEGVRAGETMGR